MQIVNYIYRMVFDNTKKAVDSLKFIHKSIKHPLLTILQPITEYINKFMNKYGFIKGNQRSTIQNKDQL